MVSSENPNWFEIAEVDFIKTAFRQSESILINAELYLQ